MATPRYNSGTLVQIPDGFPTQLRNFKKRHGFTTRQMVWKIAADSKGKRISEHALGNLMSCDGKRPPQDRVGSVLLSNVKKMMREVTEDKHVAGKAFQGVRTSKDRPWRLVGPETDDEFAYRFTGKGSPPKLKRTIKNGMWQDQALTVKECGDVYKTLDEADQMIVSGLITRLVTVDPRKEAVDQLLDMAAKLESNLLNETA